MSDGSDKARASCLVKLKRGPMSDKGQVNFDDCLKHELQVEKIKNAIERPIYSCYNLPGIIISEFRQQFCPVENRRRIIRSPRISGFSVREGLA